MTPKIQGTSRLTRKKLAAAYRAIYAVGALSIFFGLLVTIFSDRVPGGIPLAIIFFAFGALYILLGFFVQHQSAIALAIAIAVMTLNTLVGVYNLSVMEREDSRYNESETNRLTGDESRPTN